MFRRRNNIHMFIMQPMWTFSTMVRTWISINMFEAQALLPQKRKYSKSINDEHGKHCFSFNSINNMSNIKKTMMYISAKSIRDIQSIIPHTKI